jgi:hypothetical protein
MDGFPGGLSELEFVEAYRRGALRKPELAADMALRALAFADAGDRTVFAGVIAQELAEACRRLTAVCAALGDRRYSIARSLLRPLPGLEEWETFAQKAAIYAPERMLFDLGLGEEALPHAIAVRSQPDLAGLSGLVAAAEAGSAMVLVPPGERAEAWLAGAAERRSPVAASVLATEAEAAALADLTGDLCGAARGFLGAYLGARRTAGWRGDR